jgi:hypothetical protein
LPYINTEQRLSLKVADLCKPLSSAFTPTPTLSEDPIRTTSSAALTHAAAKVNNNTGDGVMGKIKRSLKELFAKEVDGNYASHEDVTTATTATATPTATATIVGAQGAMVYKPNFGGDATPPPQRNTTELSALVAASEHARLQIEAAELELMYGA